MVYKKNYTAPSEFTENDDIYDEESDYYTKDCDLCSSCENKIFFNYMFQHDDYPRWR